MSKMFVGYVQGFHGLKGELKIKNKFSMPEKVFMRNKKIYLNDEEHDITNVRFHKDFYLVEIDELKNINLVEKYKGCDLFISRDELNLATDEFLIEDLFGMAIIYNDQNMGVVKDVLKNNSQDVLEIDYNGKYFIPLVEEYVVKVDLVKKQIVVKNIGGLML